MALLFNKDNKIMNIGMFIAVHLMLEQKNYESRNQPAQSPLRSIELPKRTRSIQVYIPSKGEEHSRSFQIRIPSKGEEQSRSFQVRIPSKGEERSRSIRVRIPSKGEERSHAEGSRTSPKTEWIININSKIKQASHDEAARSWDKLCIYRVPQRLRDDRDGNAYIPQIVSLGPYHHGKLPEMDQHKWRTIAHILKRNNQSIELYLDAVKELEEQARSCYEGTISLSSNEFAAMMVLDSCFMLELFRWAIGDFPPQIYIGDPIIANSHLIYRDMIMLENQVPIFILDKLLSLQTDKPFQKGDVIKQALRFFDMFTSFEPKSQREPEKTKSPLAPHLMSAKHCLEVFRQNLLTTATKTESQTAGRRQLKNMQHCPEVSSQTEPSPRTESQTDLVGNDDGGPIDEKQFQLIHCVTELKQAGIKFKRRKTGRFWEIEFKNGVLEIPRLLIQDATKSIFLNLIAYEQSHMGNTGEITAYAIFMDSLINTAADVSYLHHKNIVENWLGNDDGVAELFNRLCREVFFNTDKSYLYDLTKEVNEHYDRKWNTMKASLSHKYFNSPWATISFFAALMLLFFTFLQTFFTVYPYFNPPS